MYMRYLSKKLSDYFYTGADGADPNGAKRQDFRIIAARAQGRLHA